MADKLGLEPKILIVRNQKNDGSFRDLDMLQQPMNIVVETDPARTLDRFTAESPDLLILDVDLESGAVIDLLGTLRAQMYIPIILLTSEESEAFILDAYHAGADDCIPRTVSDELLQAKASVWLRRSWSAGPGILDSLKIGQMKLLPSEKMLVLDDHQAVRLTNLEVRLLHNLMRRAGHAVSTEELTEKVWGYSGEVDHTLIKNVVYRLRRKIETDPARPSIIETVSGVGYRLTAE